MTARPRQKGNGLALLSFCLTCLCGHKHMVLIKTNSKSSILRPRIHTEQNYVPHLGNHHPQNTLFSCQKYLILLVQGHAPNLVSPVRNPVDVSIPCASVLTWLPSTFSSSLPSPLILLVYILFCTRLLHIPLCGTRLTRMVICSTHTNYKPKVISEIYSLPFMSRQIPNATCCILLKPTSLLHYHHHLVF